MEPDWSQTFTFSGGLGLAAKEGAHFVVKRDELTLVPVETETTYGWARPFTEGLAPVQDRFSWGFIDGSGKFVIPPQFDWAYNFNEGLALVEKGNSVGYVDTSGQFVIGPIGSQQGLTQYVVAPMGAQHGAFREGLLPLTTSDGKWGYRTRWRTCYLDRRSRPVITTDFPEAQSFSEGLAAVRDAKGRWGYIDKRGRLVITPQFAAAGPFAEGLACVGVRPGE